MSVLSDIQGHSSASLFELRIAQTGPRSCSFPLSCVPRVPLFTTQQGYLCRAGVHDTLSNGLYIPVQHKPLCLMYSICVRKDGARLRKIKVQCFVGLSCPHAQITTFCLTPCELFCTLYVTHVTPDSMFFFLQARNHSFFLPKTILSDKRPCFRYCSLN